MTLSPPPLPVRPIAVGAARALWPPCCTGTSSSRAASGKLCGASRAMASRAERAEEAPPAGSGSLGALYQELSRFPRVTYASVGVGFAACGGAKCLPLYTEWCQPDLGHRQKLHFSRQYILHHNGRAVVSVTPVGIPAEIRDQSGTRVEGREALISRHWINMAEYTQMSSLVVLPGPAQKHRSFMSLREDAPKGNHFSLKPGPPKERNQVKQERSALFLFDLSESSCELLSSDSEAVSSPRLSPDGTRLLYLECPVFGPHRQCLKLQMLNWQTKLTSTVVDVVRAATSGFFGIYSGALPLLCWAADNHRVLLSTPQRSRKELLVVDTELGSVKAVTEGTPEGSWTLLGIQEDLLVVSCSSPNCPPSLKVGVLPPAGCELELQWTSVEEASVLPDMEWKILTVHPPVTEDNQYSKDAGTGSFRPAGQAFEALLLTPQGNKRGEETFPLIVSPHGGPHAVFDACWRPKMASLCQLGFAVLMVNYRGSLGFGQASIESLISRVGVQDVEDTKLAVNLALRTEPLDPDRIALLGGSHGGFVCCHLIARYPEMCKACVVRSPVINMATLLGTSDIPDWRYAVLGLPYCFERIPAEEDLTAMLLCSPIIHAAKVHTPLLMYVGARDRRVSPYQALEYYRVLRARGTPVRLLWYPEENHAISGMEAEADVFMNSAQWIMHYLSKEADPESQQPAEK
ncbi:acylamino-acid-releasing enzyme isoform X7 [Zootoca vivipara]|uniref:acylamino-acid-releasing enzyme isoform X7 n=1 Tax=Zootoca vivipara TaxID=8524 RepID=UPI00159225BF|nr:acylamino-acid-releasing enzyme isoform X7 [Zootoca vivipara]